ncbi:MAG TPA: DUF1003 domain-containing protein [Mycobacterium sp.]|nr:DUF1003 domain-containing protein [Mycobacterium sp.]
MPIGTAAPRPPSRSVASAAITCRPANSWFSWPRADLKRVHRCGNTAAVAHSYGEPCQTPPLITRRTTGSCQGYPFGLLTMIVSLEAIFRSTSVMISQNRADFKRQAAADLQWKMAQEQDAQNKQLIELSNQILELTRLIHAHTQATQSVKQ